MTVVKIIAAAYTLCNEHHHQICIVSDFIRYFRDTNVLFSRAGGKTGEARLQATSCMHLPLDEEEELEWSPAVSGTEGLVAATTAFLEEVAALPNLVAVLTGTEHLEAGKHGTYFVKTTSISH